MTLFNVDEQTVAVSRSDEVQLSDDDNTQCLIERRGDAQTHLVGTPVEAADWLRRQRDILQQVQAAGHAHVTSAVT